MTKTIKNAAAAKYFSLFIQPVKEIENLQNIAIRKNIPVIVNACAAVKKADAAKEAASKDKNIAFKTALKDWQFLADRDNRTHLNSIRNIIKHGMDDAKTLQAAADSVSENIVSVSGLWNKIKPKTDAAPKNAGEKEAEKMNPDELAAMADMLQEKQTISQCFETMLKMLVSSGHSPNEFWDFAGTDAAEKLSTQYQTIYLKQSGQIKAGQKKMAAA